MGSPNLRSRRVAALRSVWLRAPGDLLLETAGRTTRRSSRERPLGVVDCGDQARTIAWDLARRALITGIGGQDGSLLCEFLLSKGYRVAGIVRRDPSSYGADFGRVLDQIELVKADLLAQDSLVQALELTQPDEVYNLASPSFVPRSWDQPVLTAHFSAVGVTSLLEAVRAVNSRIRVYQASSSEIFGEPFEVPQTEDTPLSPVTPYGVAKAYGHFMVKSYRRRYGLYACCGILYNHESPRRPLDFLLTQGGSCGSRDLSGLQ